MKNPTIIRPKKLPVTVSVVIGLAVVLVVDVVEVVVVVVVVVVVEDVEDVYAPMGNRAK